MPIAPNQKPSQLDFECEKERYEKEARVENTEILRLNNALANGFIQAAITGLLSNSDSPLLEGTGTYDRRLKDLAETAVDIALRVQEEVDENEETFREMYGV